MDFMYPIAMLAKLYLYLYLMKTCRFYFDIEMNKVNCWHSQWLAVFFVFTSQQVGQLNFANIFIGYKKSILINLIEMLVRFYWIYFPRKMHDEWWNRAV